VPTLHGGRTEPNDDMAAIIRHRIRFRGGMDRSKPAYLINTIKTPAAIARMAIIVPSPEKLRLSNGIRPVKMSQMPSRSMPRFFGNFIGGILSSVELRVFYGKRGSARHRPTLRFIWSMLYWLIRASLRCGRSRSMTRRTAKTTMTE
jgi:hypothetical protein